MKYLQYLRESQSTNPKLCADLDELLDLNRTSYENAIAELNSRLELVELENKEIKQQQKQMNIRLRKVEEVVHMAQIEIDFRVEDVSSGQWIATCNLQV